MKSLDTLVSDYRATHRDPVNRKLHVLGIPMIVLGVFGFSGQFFGFLIWGAVSSFYVLKGKRAGVLFSATLLGIWALGKSMGFFGSVGIFSAGWVLQLLGHRDFERNSPAFFDSLQQLLIGPFVLFCDFLGIHPDRSEVENVKRRET